MVNASSVCVCVSVSVTTCMQPDLSQGHPGVQGSLLGCAALQGRRHLGESLLYSAGRDGRGVDRTCRGRGGGVIERHSVRLSQRTPSPAYPHPLLNRRYSFALQWHSRQPCAAVQSWGEGRTDGRTNGQSWAELEEKRSSETAGFLILFPRRATL